MVINFILHSTVQNTTENIEHFKHIHAHSIIHFLFCVDLTEASVWCCMLPSLSLVPRPLPLIRGLVLTVCAFVKFPVIFSFVHLPCLYAETILTKNTEN